MENASLIERHATSNILSAGDLVANVRVHVPCRVIGGSCLFAVSYRTDIFSQDHTYTSLFQSINSLGQRQVQLLSHRLEKWQLGFVAELFRLLVTKISLLNRGSREQLDEVVDKALQILDEIVEILSLVQSPLRLLGLAGVFLAPVTDFQNALMEGC